jgi:hypothetical protein
MSDIHAVLAEMLAAAESLRLDPLDRGKNIALLASLNEKAQTLFVRAKFKTHKQAEAMEEIHRHLDAFVLWAGRLDDDFLETIDDEPVNLHDPRLPQALLAKQILRAIELFTPADVAATEAPGSAVESWYSKATLIVQTILKDVDQLLNDGARLPIDFTEKVISTSSRNPKTIGGTVVYAGRPVQILLNNLNEILREALKPCRFSAPNDGNNLVLKASEPDAGRRGTANNNAVNAANTRRNKGKKPS